MTKFPHNPQRSDTVSFGRFKQLDGRMRVRAGTRGEREMAAGRSPRLRHLTRFSLCFGAHSTAQSLLFWQRWRGGLSYIAGYNSKL